jgi:hypothetical protein
MISPNRIVKLQYCIEQRLVKITRAYMGDDEAFIWFGFTDGVEDFLHSIKQGRPNLKVVRIEA